MKNIVSFETAKALKDAGFPQPEPEAGQFWYSAFNGSNWLSIVAHERGKPDVLFFCPLYVLDWRHFFGATGVILGEDKTPGFAPTATDILEQLGEYFSIGSWKGKFVINQHPELLPEPIGAPARYHGTHDNPAEAAAAAWLALKKVLEI